MIYVFSWDLGEVILYTKLDFKFMDDFLHGGVKLGL